MGAFLEKKPMDISTYIQSLVTTAGVLMGIWGFFKVVSDIKKNNDEEHDRRQRWDNAAKVIEENKDKWDKGLDDVYEERKKIVEKYDKRLEEIDRHIDKNHADTEAKIQEVQAEILILTECMRAVLDGLHQQGCNGRVTEASAKLDNYLVGLIGK